MKALKRRTGRPITVPEREAARESRRKKYASDPSKQKEHNRKYSAETPQKKVAYLARNRRSYAKRKGIVYTINPDKLLAPRCCPLCGCELVYNHTKAQHNSPSIDRVVPSVGYTPENTWVTCWGCNRVKCDATVEQLELIATNLRLKIESML